MPLSSSKVSTPHLSQPPSPVLSVSAKRFSSYVQSFNAASLHRLSSVPPPYLAQRARTAPVPQLVHPLYLHQRCTHEPLYVLSFAVCSLSLSTAQNCETKTVYWGWAPMRNRGFFLLLTEISQGSPPSLRGVNHIPNERSRKRVSERASSHPCLLQDVCVIVCT